MFWEEISLMNLVKKMMDAVQEYTTSKNESEIQPNRPDLKVQAFTIFSSDIPDQCSQVQSIQVPHQMHPLYPVGRTYPC